ncbi:hypothetical protein [Burkholderia pyrrocinia]|uniref:hypothetical protein n=1 Tax=Burkholderia pyrrocinia TaxID=60550 RepID=UPI00201B92B4|nr:hypothetical protein [Burkholderia pyrrocinia]
MKISFGQIYPEVGVSFDFTNTVLAELNEGINSLEGSFAHYVKLFSGDDFSVVFIISATKKSDILSVKGPTTLAKKKRVEFVLHIPYKQFESFLDQMDYALNFIECGVKSTFDRYNSDSSGVAEMVSRTKDAIRADPDKYMKWIK